ncbi:hypothetical protein CAPTEDRAFT_200183 [Capitella teleta]|uniref:Uncharacterized protein n=1 Tax=Capitella teleta TaxID=283909 RepID=R7VBL2_CAPTE|nr:hypothetical protein CAPTEDRAFT_200183 [Capitella teleta]|eukprot:ELU16029.1 hypothetical protein CAPTEDRAFT_200183 [Capitella teleta]
MIPGKCLSFLEKVDTLGGTMRVEIWIDRSGRGEVDDGTVKVAESFKQRWTKPHLGHTCAIHIREKNAGITGQWTDTWRPKVGSKEIGLLLEDDIDVSPMVYRWLKAVHAKYDDRDDVSGYTIQMQNFRFHGSSKPATKVVPKSDSVFMYSILGTWGFSPHPKSWRNFQDWVHDARDNNKIEPIVPGLDQLNRWYNRFSKQQSMPEMWHIYFSYINGLYCVHPNLEAYTGKHNMMLAWNRQEKGLHFKAVKFPESEHCARWMISSGVRFSVKLDGKKAAIDHTGISKHKQNVDRDGHEKIQHKQLVDKFIKQHNR